MSQCQTTTCVCVRAAECKRGTDSECDFSALLEFRGKEGLPSGEVKCQRSSRLHLGVPGILLLPAHSLHFY